MVRMAHPWKDPKSGSYFLRIKVPADIRPRAKGRKVTLPIAETTVTVTMGDVVQVSLRTRDQREAKSRYIAAHANLAATWEAIRLGPAKLTYRDVVALAGDAYKAFAYGLEDDPGKAELWAKVLADNAKAAAGGLSLKIGTEAQIADSLDQRFGPIADAIIRKRSLDLDAETRHAVIVETAKAMDEAAQKLQRNAQGDYRPDGTGERFPTFTPSAKPKAVPTVTFDDLFDKWKKRKARAASSIRRWEPIITKALPDFLGHKDAAAVTKADLVRWRDHLIAAGTNAPRVIRSTHLASVRAVYSVWVADDLLPTNPAKGVVMDVSAPLVVREKGFTDAEAKKILKATTTTLQGGRTDFTQAALRWLPWLCAYAGCRITELAQLRREDVRQDPEGRFWMIRITPDAGSVKGRRYRDIPLHPHLVEQGFITFVQASAEGPLFHEKTAKGAKAASQGPAQTVGKMITRWVRDTVGIKDTRVQPNHGWRHRFTTVSRSVSMDHEKREYIVGHALPGMGDTYGDMAGLYSEVVKLPRIKV